MSVVDINFGCPVRDVVEKAHSGSYLLRHPDRMQAIIERVVAACAPVPVTAKIRLGCSRNAINAIEVAQVVEAAGAAALTVHGRTAQDYFKGSADWDRIAEIKPFLRKIPLIGNGDLSSPAAVVEAFRRYAVDGVMIARAALNKPWLFRQVRAALRGEPIPPDPTVAEERALLLHHYRLVCERFGEAKGTVLMRKFACCYAQGRPGAREFRTHASRVSTPEEFRSVVERRSFPAKLTGLGSPALSSADLATAPAASVAIASQAASSTRRQVWLHLGGCWQDRYNRYQSENRHFWQLRFNCYLRFYRQNTQSRIGARGMAVCRYLPIDGTQAINFLGGKRIMQRHVYCFAFLILAAPASLAAEESGYFGPLGRMGYQAQVSDLPDTEALQVMAQAADPLNSGVVDVPAGPGRCDYGCALADDCNDCWHIRPNGFWGRAEALGWWVRGSQAPPLLSTGPANPPAPPPPPTTGVLPGATVLYPTNDLNQQGRFGGRFTLGYWLDECETAGFVGSVFVLSNASHTFGASGASTSSGILARPFFNTQTQAEDAGILAYPGFTTGTAAITTQIRLVGAEINFRQALTGNGPNRIDFLMGYRYLRFDDSLVMNTSVTGLTGSPFPGTNLSTNDTFGTRNSFNGGQFGLMFQHNQGKWGLDATTKLAIGGLNEKVTVAGTTAVTPAGGGTTSLTGGFLALGSNSGTYGRTRFSLIPEINTNLTYLLTPLWKINLGYTFFVVTQVLRASDQIDRNINPQQFPPPAGGSNNTPPNPNHNLFTSDLWVQGVSLGMECRF